MKVDEKTAPWIPPLYDKADVSALKALEGGVATPEQQQRALRWIIQNACGTYEMSYRPTSDRDTTFAEGRRFVGLQVVKMLRLNMAAFGNKPSQQP